MGILSGLFKKQKPPEETDGAALVSQALSIVEGVKAAVRSLSSADAVAEARLKAAAAESRNQLCLKLSNLLSGLEQKPPLEFSVQLTSVLRELASTNLKHRYYCGLVFPRKMAELSRQLNSLQNAAVLLEKFSQSEKERLRPQEESALREHRAEESRRKLYELESQLSELRSLRDSLESDITKGTVLTPDFEQAAQAALRADADLRALESQVYSLIAPSSRALKKYLKASTLDAQLQRLLASYLEAPARAAALDRGERLGAILLDVRRVLPQLGVDSKDEHKLSELEKSTSSGAFASLASRLSDAQIDCEKRRVELEKITASKKSRDSTAEAAGKELARTRERIATLEKQKQELERAAATKAA